MPSISNNFLSGLPENPPNFTTLNQDSFSRGVISVIDETKLPRNALKEARNLTLSGDGSPQVRAGVDWYGTAPSGSAIEGMAMHVMPDDSVHLLTIAGGKVYRSLNDGVTWTVCATSAPLEVVFTTGHKVRSEQANAFTYLFNGWDTMVRYNGTTTLQTYTALTTPTGNTLTAVAALTVAPIIRTYRYRVSAVNDVGFTIASTALTIGVNRDRLDFDTTNFTTFTWNLVTNAVRYDIYVGQIPGEENYIDSVEGNGTLTYLDKGTAVEQVSVQAPVDNTTQGPRAADMSLIGSRLYATADRDFPYRIWISGAGRYIGSFGSAYDSTYLDWQKGGQLKPVKTEDYRKGNNEPVATVWCRSKDGRGAVLQGNLEAFTVGDVTFPVPNFYKLPGSRGTNAPDSVVNVLNDYMYYNSQAIFNLGSRAQFLNLLSTDESSANIRPHVRKIRKSASYNIAGHFQDGRLLMSVPYESNTNNYTIIFDTERSGWLPEGFTIGFDGFLAYTDTTAEENQHTLCYKNGDTKLSEISDTIRGDYGQPFQTSLITGLIHINPKNRFEFLWCEEGEVEVAQPRDTIEIELSGISRENGFEQLDEPKHIRPSASRYSWGLYDWTEHTWGYRASEAINYSEPSTKRYFNVQKEINAYQYRINTNSVDAFYIARTLQINGTASQGGKPVEWELHD